MGVELPDISGFRPNQHVAAAAIAAGSKLVAAARQAGVSDRQVRTWMSNHRFRAYIDGLRSVMLEEPIGLLTAAMGRAALFMIEQVDNPDVDIAVRLRAAQSIIDNATKLRDHVEFERRLGRLESPDDGVPEIEAGEGGEAQVLSPNGRA
jgi:hypothetical protein